MIEGGRREGRSRDKRRKMRERCLLHNNMDSSTMIGTPEEYHCNNDSYLPDDRDSIEMWLVTVGHDLITEIVPHSCSQDAQTYTTSMGGRGSMHSSSDIVYHIILCKPLRCSHATAETLQLLNVTGCPVSPPDIM